MMGSFRRPRPRFMSSPVLSDLARFHASSTSLQLSNASVWNSVQSAVIKVFQGGALQTNELFTLNESIRWLLKTEMGSFITDYLQNQLLTPGLSEVLDQVLLHSGESALRSGTVNPIMLGNSTPLSLSLCQGTHESGLPSLEYYQLERLVAIVVSPYLSNVLHNRNPTQLLEPRHLCSSPKVTVTQHHTWSDSASLAPLVEQEGEAYLEKSGGVRRHTVASAPSDVRLLSAAGRMHAGKGREMDNGVGGGGGVEFMVGGGTMSPRTFSSQPDVAEAPRGRVISLPRS
ncbi:proline-rich protein 5-like [Perca fluviatilis]|uniref:proline-rich protein 5-like n=1 Tax=Perca fluviatilis TaxID=8168 RepID=UPI001962FFED|nr:proline-rich protein 5-like [Perca fluviatilis]